MGDYVLATTTETGEDGFPKMPGSINGGFFVTDATSDPYPHVVIAVDELDDSMGKVKAAGGEVLGEPLNIPGIGIYVTIRDSEGNQVALLHTSPPTLSPGESR